jgi:hypothetical protein
LENEFPSKELSEEEDSKEEKKEENKLDELINLISKTEVLGENTREVVLAKIR